MGVYSLVFKESFLYQKNYKEKKKMIIPDLSYYTFNHLKDVNYFKYNARKNGSIINVIFFVASNDIIENICKRYPYLVKYYGNYFNL